MPAACGPICGQAPGQPRQSRAGAAFQRTALFLGRSNKPQISAAAAQARRYSARLFVHAPHLLLSTVAASLFCLVVAISDGDTLTVRCGTPGEYRPQKVRIVSIDAPESKQAFGQRARQNLAQLCFRQQAALRTQGHDAYGRLLAHVRCAGRDVASEQIGAGLAWVYTPHASRYPELAALQRKARASHTGLWSQKRPQAPWDYRRRHPR